MGGGGAACGQNILLLPGRLPVGEEVVPDAGGVAILATPGRDWLSDAGTAGDFDGDGTQDLFYASVGCEIDRGSVYVLSGPTAGWGAGGTTTELASGWWEQAEPNDCFALEVSGGEDIDGDGLSDLLASYPDTYVIRGRSSGLAPGLSVGDEVVFEGDAYNHALLPDMDGDGIGEAALQLFTPEREYFVAYLDPGAVAGGEWGMTVEEVSDVVDMGTSIMVRFHPGRSALGDVNGDGLMDASVVAGVPGAGADGGPAPCEGVLFGAVDLRTGPASDHLDRFVCAEDLSVQDSDRVVADMDRDGILDVYVASSMGPFSPLGDARGCVFASSRRPETGWAMLLETRPYCFDEQAESPYAVVGAADLDADGFPEFLSSDPSYAIDAGRIAVAPGFDIPWDDASRW